jgi:hypothetical protein
VNTHYLSMSHDAKRDAVLASKGFHYEILTLQIQHLMASLDVLVIITLLNHSIKQKKWLQNDIISRRFLFIKWENIPFTLSDLSGSILSFVTQEHTLMCSYVDLIIFLFSVPARFMEF